MKQRTYMMLLVWIAIVMVLQGCGTTKAETASSKLIHAEKTLPLDYFELAEQGVLVYKASNQDEYKELWEKFRLKEELQNEMDWEQNVAIFLGIVESGSCPLQFKSAELAEQNTEILVHLEGSSEMSCTDDATPRTIVIEMNQNELAGVGFVKIDNYFGINPRVEFHQLEESN
ncbi:hypothetical protein EKG37_03700 [Robertmurraya yapensis]|uniref:Lipoprotein n=2 Tax=Bacillaceae TaxID=186817 RepID=A0A431WJH9_9BACI|nr:hypothetical protein [Bacillus yapensis]RTR35747.1 hypothetical protein EKG37_03700 [Bacillus yapensis]TKS98549.1 hypothetical protein FAR12_03700 [Bacillus yapensis]